MLPSSPLIEIGTEHRLADAESLAMMLESFVAVKRQNG